MVFCPNCGHELTEEQKFCTNCGRPSSSSPKADAPQGTSASLRQESDGDRVGPDSTEFSVNTGPSQVAKAPRAPEIGLAWSLFLTPIAGAIFFSSNWKRLGKPQHQWWTWLSAVAVLVWYFASYAMFGNLWPGFITVFAWEILVYVLQKRITPSQLRSTAGLVVSTILLLFNVGIAIYTMRPESIGGNGSSLQIGTSYNKNSSVLAVSGSNFTTDSNLYARIFDQTSFGTSQIYFLLQKQNGQGWQQVFDTPATVAPNDDVLVEPFYVTTSGTYQMDALKGSQIIAQTTFTVQ